MESTASLQAPATKFESKASLEPLVKRPQASLEPRVDRPEYTGPSHSGSLGFLLDEPDNYGMTHYGIVYKLCTNFELCINYESIFGLFEHTRNNIVRIDLQLADLRTTDPNDATKVISKTFTSLPLHKIALLVRIAKP